jgi:hypothetical protein
VAKANRRALETSMTREEAIAQPHKKLANTNKWPSRRFRVEGSRAGNSYLLTKKRAESMQRQMGGVVVELIHERPKEAKAPRVSKNEERAIGMLACPRCSAEADKPCRSTGGSEAPRTIVAPHKVRVVAHEAVKSERNRALAESVSRGPARAKDEESDLAYSMRMNGGIE